MTGGLEFRSRIDALSSSTPPWDGLEDPWVTPSLGVIVSSRLVM